MSERVEAIRRAFRVDISRDEHQEVNEALDALKAENADLRRRLECEHAVALELIAERDRAVAALERLQQPSLWAESA